MRDLNHQLKQLCRHPREGSFGTQAQRERELTLIANQLHELGYRGMNRMAAFRWWAEKLISKAKTTRAGQPLTSSTPCPPLQR